MDNIPEITDEITKALNVNDLPNGKTRIPANIILNKLGKSIILSIEIKLEKVEKQV